MVTLTYMPTEHVPVLAAEVIRETDPRPGETVVDCTFGGGGHSRLLAERIGPTGTRLRDRHRISWRRWRQKSGQFDPCATVPGGQHSPFDFLCQFGQPGRGDLRFLSVTSSCDT